MLSVNVRFKIIMSCIAGHQMALPVPITAFSSLSLLWLSSRHFQLSSALIWVRIWKSCRCSPGSLIPSLGFEGRAWSWWWMLNLRQHLSPRSSLTQPAPTDAVSTHKTMSSWNTSIKYQPRLNICQQKIYKNVQNICNLFSEYSVNDDGWKINMKN